MLSILIPVKDYNCSLLVEALHAQGERLQVPYEILIGEDGSSQELLTLNAIADRLPNCRRIIKETNVGRAAIRNLLPDLISSFKSSPSNLLVLLIISTIVFSSVRNSKFHYIFKLTI